ncbi:hypothetical protein HT136_23215 [Novosphingobium profundi]|uniref:hypothetical protein n=1 Tax=Novosphingobium profundi TaxID=1774954 RepID=UPI001BD97C92|nr:hypothetical protein [Novosphingobium profundi]MBT0671285.1 hypothetical protein [Novosphingobium profundi]
MNDFLSSNLVHEALRNLTNARPNNSGWSSFNAPCCQHRGHSRDTRKRGGFKLDGETVIYNCFNCQMKAGWTPGDWLSGNMEKVLSWAGMSADALRDLKFNVGMVKHRMEHGSAVLLPDGLQSVMTWVEAGEHDPRLIGIATFLQSFDPPYDLRQFYWTPDDNGIALDTYVVALMGDMDAPKGWTAFPCLDPEQPHRTHKGVTPEPEDEEPTQDEIDKLRAYVFGDDEY